MPVELLFSIPCSDLGCALKIVFSCKYLIFNTSNNIGGDFQYSRSFEYQGKFSLIAL